jgi:NAD+ synthase (glutamine-hydrolysing)
MNASYRHLTNQRTELGLLRVAVVSPEMRVADIAFNLQAMRKALDKAAARRCQLVIFPELALTAYSCADLFYQDLLLAQARTALLVLAEATRTPALSAVVGLPLAVDGRIYNCAAMISAGQVLGIVPKTYLPTNNEYYEERWFTSAKQATTQTLRLAGQGGELAIPFGADLLFAAHNAPGVVIGIEICEDLWAVNPPSGALALAGATLLVNPSASDELLGKAEYRRDLVRQQSARCLAAYLYAGAGPGESTTDVVFGGHSIIAENGTVLAESERFRFETQMVVADIDLQRLAHERWNNSSFSAAGARNSLRTIYFHLPLPSPDPDDLLRAVARTPFVPSDQSQRAKHCHEIFDIQATGLMKRLRHTGAQRVAIGVSGGLDSTLALLVTVRAFDRLGWPRSGITAITMPGFGTSDRTYENALQLMKMLGVTRREIPIAAAVRQHFDDIGHNENIHDITYENAQARERTQILMDVANQISGFVVGTGDLSELALGWCTFNGDHMSMYHVNAGVPKTLVRYLIEWCAESEFTGEEAALLRDVCATPITPELLPLGKDGKLQQQTEESIGPYVLHDFFLFYVVRYGFSPAKVFFLACYAFDGEYGAEAILRWLKEFYRRFFTQQFKRSAMPDGPKVGTVALSPRGDWRMPSDASVALWKSEVEAI